MELPGELPVRKSGWRQFPNVLPGRRTGLPDCPDVLPGRRSGWHDCSDVLPGRRTGLEDCPDVHPGRRSGWRDCGSDLARVAITRKRSDITHDRYPRLRNISLLKNNKKFLIMKISLAVHIFKFTMIKEDYYTFQEYIIFYLKTVLFDTQNGKRLILKKLYLSSLERKLLFY